MLWLAYAQGSSHREIAAALALKTGSIKLLLFRARRKLAGLLRDARIAGRTIVTPFECAFEQDVIRRGGHRSDGPTAATRSCARTSRAARPVRISRRSARRCAAKASRRGTKQARRRRAWCGGAPRCERARRPRAPPPVRFVSCKAPPSQRWPASPPRSPAQRPHRSSGGSPRLLPCRLSTSCRPASPSRPPSSSAACCSARSPGSCGISRLR